MRLRRLAVAAAALLVATVPAATAPAAATAALASEAQYIAAQGPIQRSGYWGSHPNLHDSEVLEIGRIACSYIVRGYSDPLVVQFMVPPDLAPVGSAGHGKALEAVRDARRYLCP
jgi:hypothetical protein